MKRPRSLFRFSNVLGLALTLAATSLAWADSDKGHGKNSLPPGLEKKVEQGKPLPPGWQKKLRVGHRLDDDIYAHARLVKSFGKDGLIDINIDGRLLRLNEKTREIISILD